MNSGSCLFSHSSTDAVDSESTDAVEESKVFFVMILNDEDWSLSKSTGGRIFNVGMGTATLGGSLITALVAG